MTTWTEVRRMISRRIHEPMFHRINGPVTLGGGDSLSFYSTVLSKFTTETGLPYTHAYVSYTTDGNAPVGEEQEITRFLSGSGLGYAYVNPAFTANLDPSDKVEIHSIFTVQEKADAVNQSIIDCWPAFYQLAVNESIIMQKFKRTYSMAAFNPLPTHVISTYIEPTFRIAIGKATGGAADRLIDTTVGDPNFEPGKSYKIVIYYGTGTGQEKDLDSDGYIHGSGNFVLQAGQTFNPVPTTTSEYMIKNVSDVYYNWLGPITRVRVDHDENPTTLEILADNYELWGSRLRVIYASDLPQIAGESTEWDDEIAMFLVPRALYHLYLQRVGWGPQFEVKTAATLADQYLQESEKYRQQHRMKSLSSTIRTQPRDAASWADRELPFRR